MKKVLKKIIFILIIIFYMFQMTCVLGMSLSDLETGSGNTSDIESVGASIINIVAIIGSAASIIAMIALGIKYMLGSVEEKAQYKKTLLPYFIGAIFVFGATTIPSVIYNMF